MESTASKRGSYDGQLTRLGPGYMTLSQVAGACGVTRAAVSTWIKDGKLKALRVRRRVYVTRASLVEYLGPEAARRLLT